MWIYTFDVVRYNNVIVQYIGRLKDFQKEKFPKAVVSLIDTEIRFLIAFYGSLQNDRENYYYHFFSNSHRKPLQCTLTIALNPKQHHDSWKDIVDEISTLCHFVRNDTASQINC